MKNVTQDPVNRLGRTSRRSRASLPKGPRMRFVGEAGWNGAGWRLRRRRSQKIGARWRAQHSHRGRESSPPVRPECAHHGTPALRTFHTGMAGRIWEKSAERTMRSRASLPKGPRMRSLQRVKLRRPHSSPTAPAAGCPRVHRFRLCFLGATVSSIGERRPANPEDKKGAGRSPLLETITVNSGDLTGGVSEPTGRPETRATVS